MNLYRIVRPIVTLAFRLYFRKIYYSGIEKIPQGKPMIFSCNHPTGFFEPCLLACITWEVEYHFITRGDMFANPVVRRILESLNMVPIYRFKDGFANLKNNASTMAYIYKALAEKKSILIFSEGGTTTIKQLRPIQKGLARMAFGNYEQYGDLDLQVIPVCCTYIEPHQMRSEVMIQYGDPIPLSKYYDIYAQNQPKAIAQLTADVEAAMQPLLVHIAQKENEPLLDKLILLYQNSFPEPIFPIIQKSKKRLLALKEIADNINQMTDNDRLILENKTNIYFDTLKNKGIDDIAIAQPWHNTTSNRASLIIGYIPFLIGKVGHYIAAWYAVKVRKEKVIYLEFEGPVMAAVGIGVILIQYILLLIIAFILNKTVFWIFVFTLPILGYYSLIYNELRKKYRACAALKGVDTEGVSQLQNERESILNMVRRPPIYSYS
jgi:glycerol-3-phosphate O-acyltransferase / dihydroxyacetone phosphate acyltransferase